jgi:hypothetical protein
MNSISTIRQAAPQGRKNVIAQRKLNENSWNHRSNLDRLRHYRACLRWVHLHQTRKNERCGAAASERGPLENIAFAQLTALPPAKIRTPSPNIATKKSVDGVMAGYGCARTYAEMLGDRQGAQLLQTTLTEESETDKKLTKLAKSVINVAAK